jgi:hypothetical protein
MVFSVIDQYVEPRIIKPWSALRKFDQPSASGFPSASTAGLLCLRRPDRLYIALDRNEADDDVDGLRKERRTTTGLYDKYYKYCSVSRVL